MLCTVAGLSSRISADRPFSALHASTASRMAKKTEELSSSGGSPIPFEE